MGVWVSAVIHRCLGERQEEEAETPFAAVSHGEPIFHGVPGAGKNTNFKVAAAIF